MTTRLCEFLYTSIGSIEVTQEMHDRVLSFTVSRFCGGILSAKEPDKVEIVFVLVNMNESQEGTAGIPLLFRF